MVGVGRLGVLLFNAGWLCTSFEFWEQLIHDDDT